MIEVLDFREGVLASRLTAAEDLRKVPPDMATGTSVLIDIGDNLATTSWVDGFLVPLARRLGEEYALIIVAASDVTRNHITRVFSSRGVKARIANTRDAAIQGEWNLIPG
jgi:hypothetical protein